MIWKSDRNSSRKASNSESERSISSISSTAPARRPHGPQQRPLEQEALVVEVADVAPLGLGHAHVQQLLGVVPLVQGLGGVEPLVALQADQLAPEHVGQHLGHLGLAHARLALERQRAAQHEREVDRREQPLVGEVALLGEAARRAPRRRGRASGRFTSGVDRRAAPAPA